VFTEKDITTIEVEGKTYTAIMFGNKDMEIPSYLLQGEKQPGYLFTDGNLRPWFWSGFNVIGEKRCVYFEKMNIHPMSELALGLRHRAPQLITALAQALRLCTNAFLDLDGGIMSAWRIFFTDEGDVLLLPHDIADIFASSVSNEARFDNSTGWIHAELHRPFSLIDQMAQFYYYAITGFKPFGREDVRETGFSIIPLKLCGPVFAPSLDAKLASRLDGILTLPLGKQRELSGNMNPQVALEWFIERFKDVSWDLENLEVLPDPEETMHKNKKLNEFLVAKSKKAERKKFWRHKGVKITIIAAAIIIVGAFTASRIKEALAPPYTADMAPEQVIQAYYQAQNDLDVTKLDASLSRGTKSPVETEVTTLFVTRQTRMAYENVPAFIAPKTWIDEGKPALAATTNIYGVTDISIQDLGKGYYRATATLYSPSDYLSSSDEDEDVTEPEGYTYCYCYQQQQTFHLTMSKHGWYLIDSISQDKVSYLYTLKIPTYTKTKALGQLAAGAASQAADAKEAASAKQVEIIHDKKLEANSEHLLDEK
jgi:hypothetical protein